MTILYLIVLTMETKPVDEVFSCSQLDPGDMKVLLESSCKPLVLKNCLESWLNARSWEAKDVCMDLSPTPPTTFKIFYRRDCETYKRIQDEEKGGVAFFETDCTYVKTTFGNFKEWLEAQERESRMETACPSPPKKAKINHRRKKKEREVSLDASKEREAVLDANLGPTQSESDGEDLGVPESNPLSLASPASDFWVYADYKYMCNMCQDVPSLQRAVDWGTTLGFKGRGWKDSVLWVGSEGACTPCHYDTYGFNLVAQLSGEKRWLLFDPRDSGFMYPTRVPFEELSVFSEVDVGGPNFDRHPLFKKATPHEVSGGRIFYFRSIRDKRDVISYPTILH